MPIPNRNEIGIENEIHEDFPVSPISDLRLLSVQKGPGFDLIEELILHAGQQKKNKLQQGPLFCTEYLLSFYSFQD